MLSIKYACQQQAAALMYRRGIAYEQRQRYQQAVDAFSWAIALNDASPMKAQVQRGINRMHLGDAAEAIADFEAVIQSEPISKFSDDLPLAQAYFYRGQLHQQNGSEAAALADWARAISCCSTYSLPYYHRALIYLENDDLDDALFDLNCAIKSYPTLARAYYQRGLLHHRAGSTICAISDLQCAIYNDFTLEAAKQKLEGLQQDVYDAQLSRVLTSALTEKGLSANVCHQGTRLHIQVHRAAGTGVNYYELPDLIREHIAPLLLDGVSHFQLSGRVGEATSPEWSQSYSLYKDRPCPPSYWPAAILAMLMFPPLAVPALIQAACVKRAYKRGEYAEAVNASNVAKKLSAASSIPFACFILLSVGYSSYDFDSKTPAMSSVEQVDVAKRLRRSVADYQ